MNKVLDVLLHISRTGRFVTDEQYVIDMAARGLLKDYGPQKIAGGMHYFTLTSKGLEMIANYRASLPQPKPVSQAKLRAKRRYKEYCDLNAYDYSFGQFLKDRYGKNIVKYELS